MSNNAHLRTFAQVAFSNHIPPHFAIRRMEQVSTDPVIFDWTVEYPDGKQFGGSAYLDEEGGGYSVCTSMEYSPDKGWSFPHTWQHGFSEAACPNS